MTWHAKALQTSYLSGHRSGVHTSDESDAAFPLYDDVLVLPRCGRRDGAGEHGRRLRVRRLDHRRNAVDAERRRSLARRAVAPASCGVRQPRVGRECRDWRQSHSDARKLSAASAVRRRAVCASAARARSLRVVRAVGCRAARRASTTSARAHRPTRSSRA